MKALISIDYTYDFVATDGKLTTGEYGQQIEEALVKVTKEFIENDDFVVFAIDGHETKDQYHPENKLFPPHNLIGTHGRDLYGKLAELYEQNKSKETLYVKNNIISANYIDFQNITIYSFSKNNSFNSNNVSKKYLSKK